MSGNEGPHPPSEAALGIFVRGLRAGPRGQVIALGAGALASVIAARLLTADQFGVVATGTALVTLLGVGASLQVNVQVSRTRDARLVAAGLRLARRATLVVVALTLGLAWLSASTGWDVTPTLLVALVPIAAVEPIQQVIAGRVAAEGRAGASAVLSALPAALRLVLLLGLVPLGEDSATAVAIAYSLAAAGGLVGARILAGPPPAAPEGQPPVGISSMITDGLKLTLVATSWLVILRTDLIVLSILAPGDEVGRYAAATRVMDLVQGLYAGLMLLLIPATSVRGSRPDAILRAGQVVPTRLLVPLTVYLATWGAEAIDLAFGGAYGDVRGPLAALSVGVLVHVVSGPAGNILVAQRRDGLVALTAGSGAVLNLALSLALGRILGSVGVAMSTAATIVFLNAVYLATLRRDGPIYFAESRYAAIIAVAGSLVLAPMHLVLHGHVGALVAGVVTVGLITVGARSPRTRRVMELADPRVGPRQT